MNSSAKGFVDLVFGRRSTHVFNTLRNEEMLATLGSATLVRLTAMVGQEEVTDERD